MAAHTVIIELLSTGAAMAALVDFAFKRATLQTVCSDFFSHESHNPFSISDAVSVVMPGFAIACP